MPDTQTLLALVLLATPVAAFGYCYLGYPLALRLLAWLRPPRPQPPAPREWPMVSITVPVYNEAQQIRGTLDSLLRLTYPADRRQILVVSDASTDGTDDIVREYAGRGIELVRMPRRGGKGVAENTVAPLLRGDIVVNTDATIRIEPGAIERLVAAFEDPTVGVASGRDVSVSRHTDDANRGESGYVGYEMWVRALETRVAGIVGASGCFYAIRAHLHRVPLAGALSRDFASAMTAREHGYRAVSVHDAVCQVPRASSLHREYRRKVRTMTRGMETLWHKRHLLNPLRHGVFAWMMLSHKVCRWAAPWTLFAGVLGLALLSGSSGVARLGLLAGGVFAGCAWLGWVLAERPGVPRILTLPAYLAMGNVAAIRAALGAARGTQEAIWEPTRRDTVVAS